MKKYFLCITLIFLLSLLASQVSADGIMPGQKGVSYCFKISNVNDFPMYYFIIGYDLTKPAGYPEIIEQGECYNFYKFAKPTIYAVRKEGFNLTFNNFYNNTKLIHSGITLQYSSTVPENNPLKGTVDILTVESVNDEQLIIKKDSVIYTYVDNTTETKQYQDQNITPGPSRKAFLPAWWPQLLFALAVTIILEFLIIWAFIRGKPLKPFLFSVVVNIITLHMATFIFTNLRQSILRGWILIELGVFLAEFLLIKKFLNQSYPRALLISFVANLVSAIIGGGIALLALTTGFLF
jgi:hypothetical protein